MFTRKTKKQRATRKNKKPQTIWISSEQCFHPHPTERTNRSGSYPRTTIPLVAL